MSQPIETVTQSFDNYARRYFVSCHQKDSVAVNHVERCFGAQRRPFCYFKTSPEVIRLAVVLYVRFALSLRNVDNPLHERGIEVSHETIRFWWNRFGPLFAAEIRRKRIQTLRAYSKWTWHLDEVFVKINGERHYLWRAVDHEGEVLESFVTKHRDRRAALKFLKKAMKRYGQPELVVIEQRRSYGTACEI